MNFWIGTDLHGFLLGCINGNGSMPFPRVTLNAAGIDAWHQVVVVKDAAGFQQFYQNGTLIHVPPSFSNISPPGTEARSPTWHAQMIQPAR